MGLDEYRRKRDFDKTNEPTGRIGRRDRPGGSFVVQKHGARSLHYDFRLELEGVLKSWAVPKGPSMDPRERRLAIPVEDHPLEYGGFEGVIPEGQYGAGAVLIWDRGRWIPVGDALAGYERGRLKFELEGEKLKGRWTLVRTGGSDDRGDRESWLLIKERDSSARGGRRGSLVEARPESVATGRHLEEVAEQRDRIWDSRHGEIDSGGAKGAGGGLESTVDLDRLPDPLELSGSHRGPLPRRPRPQLATLVSRPPDGDGWLHELKYDGYRLLCRLEDASVRLLTRNGQDWTPRLRRIAEAASRLPAASALLDGELVVMDSRGRTDFQALQNALGRPTTDDLRYVVFDLLHLEGYDLTDVPLEERKAALEELIAAAADGDAPLTYSTHVIGNGAAVHREACGLGAEGIISKRLGSRYRPLRSRDWYKIKCLQQQDFVIVGFTDPEGGRIGLGALLLAINEEGRLVYCGKVGTGFTDQSLRELRPRLERLERRTPAAEGAPVRAAARGVHWTRPELVASVSFSGWTEDRRLRHPVFQGLREDMAPEEVRREQPDPLPARGNERVEVAGVRLTNPERRFYPGIGLTKLELAAYYESVAERILPHIADRLLTLVRCPDGHEGECFYQKHVTPSFPPFIRRHRIREARKTRTYMSVDSIQAVVYLVQMGTLELHVWGSRVDRPERPDRVVFDLDPGPELEWSRVVDAAFLLRTRLLGLGLESFVKTTGGKGLHVVVPVTRRHEWDEVKGFARTVAEHMVLEDPERYTATVSKAKRRGKIYVDYLRNARGATAVTAYSTRALAGAPVSAPLSWEELEAGTRSDAFTVRTMKRRLARMEQDPWKELPGIRQSITREALRKLG